MCLNFKVLVLALLIVSISGLQIPETTNTASVQDEDNVTTEMPTTLSGTETVTMMPTTTVATSESNVTTSGSDVSNVIESAIVKDALNATEETNVKDAINVTDTIVTTSSPNVTTVGTELTTMDLITELKIGHLSPECQKQVFVTDKCISEALFLGSEDIPDIPQTPEELEFYCSRARTTYDCVNNYKKCLRLFPKTFFGMITRDVKKTMNRLCGKQGRPEVISHLKCFDVSSIPILYAIMNGWTKVLMYIADDVKPDDMVPSLCCSYQFMLDMGIKLVHEECDNKTGPGTAQFMINIIESVVASAVDIGCGRHNSLPTCNTLMPLEMDLFFNLTEIGKKEPVRYTPVIPLVKIAQNLDSGLNI